MIRRAILLILVAGITLAGASLTAAQDAATLAAALDKTKHKKKDKSKNGVTVSVETYVQITNVPAVKAPAEYSGTYLDDDAECSLELRVASDGSATGEGTETKFDADWKGSRMSFVLRGARVNGAVLMGEKVYTDGTTGRLEAVFVNRTTYTGKNENDKQIDQQRTGFGLGFVQTNGNSTSRVFLIGK